MRLEVYFPKDDVLQKYIECIYFLKKERSEEDVRFLTFPSVFTIVTLSEKSFTAENGQHLFIAESDKNEIETKIVFNFTKPVFVNYKGKINEITIYFKPLGINHFLKSDLNSYNSSSFCDFSPFDDYKIRMQEILSFSDDQKKIDAIEAYWLEKCSGFEHSFLQDAVSHITENHDSYASLAEFCKCNSISRTTLNKHFFKHLSKTPSQFKKIMRFRNAVNSYSKDKQKLTDLAYCIEYFDQPHMIREFKSLTGLTPKAFFNKTTQIEQSSIRWEFM